MRLTRCAVVRHGGGPRPDRGRRLRDRGNGQRPTSSRRPRGLSGRATFDAAVAKSLGTTTAKLNAAIKAAATARIDAALAAGEITSDEATTLKDALDDGTIPAARLATAAGVAKQLGTTEAKLNAAYSDARRRRRTHASTRRVTDGKITETYADQLKTQIDAATFPGFGAGRGGPVAITAPAGPAAGSASDFGLPPRTASSSSSGSSSSSSRHVGRGVRVGPPRSDRRRGAPRPSSRLAASARRAGEGGVGGLERVAQVDPSTTSPLVPSRFRTDPTGSDRGGPEPAPHRRPRHRRRRDRDAGSGASRRSTRRVQPRHSSRIDGSSSTRPRRRSASAITCLQRAVVVGVGAGARAADRARRGNQRLVPVDRHHVLELERLLAARRCRLEELAPARRADHGRPDAGAPGRRRARRGTRLRPIRSQRGDRAVVDRRRCGHAPCGRGCGRARRAASPRPGRPTVASQRAHGPRPMRSSSPPTKIGRPSSSTAHAASSTDGVGQRARRRGSRRGRARRASRRAAGDDLLRELALRVEQLVDPLLERRRCR